MIGIMNLAFNYDVTKILASHYDIVEFVQNFPFFTIILSLFTGVLCAALKPKSARNLCLTSLTAILIMTIMTLLYVIKTGDYYIYMMAHFPAPWGNEIRIGVLELLLSSCFTLVMILSIIGGLRHIMHDVPEDKLNYYFLMMNLLYVSLIALVYTNDVFTAYVFIEINTLTSCAIVMLKKGKETLVATMRYLIMSLLGSGLVLIGISMLYDITGHLLMSNIKEVLTVNANKYPVPLEMIICLFSIGLGIKSALYPFHSWLPDAHGSSTSSSSAILSGLVLKGYIVLLIKLFYRTIGMDIIATSKVLNILFVLGVIAMTIGSIKAIKEKDLKKMIAYSSVAQIGYIYLGIGIGGNLGMAAAIFQIFAHAFTKPMLFNCAGAFMDVSNGSKRFIDLQGAARKNLFAGIAFVIGALSMIGIPLFAGFAVKYYLVSASLVMDSRVMLTAVALIISAVLNAVYYVPAIMVLFKKTDDTQNISLFSDKPDFLFILSTIIFIIFNFVLGIGSPIFMNLINQGINTFA